MRTTYRPATIVGNHRSFILSASDFSMAIMSVADFKKDLWSNLDTSIGAWRTFFAELSSTVKSVDNLNFLEPNILSVSMISFPL